MFAGGLIKKEEIEAAQGSPIKDASSSARMDGGFHVSRCFHATPESNKSVGLALTQPNLDKADKRSLKKLEATFGRYARICFRTEIV